METEQFIVTAKTDGGDGLDLRMVVTVKSTESFISAKVTAAKNVIFDMLRSQDFDADKINMDKYENG